MFLDTAQVPHGTTLRARFCVVGAGPAGITLATELAEAGADVILLESGGRRETARARDLNVGVITDQVHEPLEENRRRRLGGSSAVWGGRCVPADAVDFAQRPWVPHSGWPIDHDDVARHYAAALQVSQAGPPEFSAHDALPGQEPSLMPGLDDGDLVSDRLERWSPPVDFGRAFHARLAGSRTLRVLLDATCRHLQLDPEGGAVTGVDVVGPTGGGFSVVAEHVVLACGGLENTRLLMASRDVAPGGIGNDHDQLGRYYMVHLFGTVAHIEPTSPPQGGFARDRHGVYVRRRIWLTEQAQQRERLLNTVFWIGRPAPGSGHRDAVFSSVALAKTLMLASRKGSHAWEDLVQQRPFLLDNAQAVAADLPGLLRRSPALFRDRLLRQRRLPAILPDMASPSLAIHFQSEHAPNPSSRVWLSSEPDALGVPRLTARPAFDAIDTDSVRRAHQLLAARCHTSGTARLLLDECELEQCLADFVERPNSAAHQLGTTRMSSDPRHGVVDENCTVHGVRNLHVIGSSVFPTGGHANPTLLLLALTFRLTERLRSITAPVSVGSS